MTPVREQRRAGGVPLYAHPEWTERFPWLVQGTTAGVDLGLAGDQPVGAALARWRTLREQTGCARACYAYQVHGTRVLWHEADAPGLYVAEDYDAHATRTPGVLLTISVADCVPISLVDPERRAIAMLHGGWRGVAGGVLAAGLRVLRERAGSDPEALWLHLGPAICGECYEVGPEVHEALGLEVPPTNSPVDLRKVLTARARRLGIPPERVTTSEFCTRCGDSPFFSHRAGEPERQLGVLGIRG